MERSGFPMEYRRFQIEHKIFQIEHRSFQMEHEGFKVEQNHVPNDLNFLFFQYFFISITEPPSALRVVNITHRSVQLEWQAGFHGGMDQYFRLQYWPSGSNEYASHEKTREKLAKYWDVYPANTPSVIVNDLEPGMEYKFDVMSTNNLGESNFTLEPIIVRTSSKS